MHSIMLDEILWRNPRPFALTSSSGPRSKIAKIPLLDGYKSQISDDAENSGQHESAQGTMVPKIDDPKNSTLTRGQQERFMKLKADRNKSRWNVHQKREYRALQEVVRNEQDLYRQARHEFLVQHVDRFMTGFRPPSEFATWQSTYARAYVNAWKSKGLPISFGKVRQIISLTQSGAVGWIPSDYFESQVIEGHSNSTHEHEIPISLPIYIPQTATPKFLIDDDMAMDVANRLNIKVIVSIEALEHVLLFDNWKCVLWKSAKGLRILELPFPQPTLPRRCLEKGIESSMHDDEFLYTMLKLTSKGKPQKILVRGPRVSPRVHIEYFPERGIEALSPHDKACWILDSIVDPKASTVLIRVNPLDWTIQSKEKVGVAHALASGNDVVIHWNRLLSFLGALDSVPPDSDFLLFCRDLSVGLHIANESEEINLALDLENADVVKTSQAALLSCSRPWQWNFADRLDDTFPTNA